SAAAGRFTALRAQCRFLYQTNPIYLPAADRAVAAPASELCDHMVGLGGDIAICVDRVAGTTFARAIERVARARPVDMVAAAASGTDSIYACIVTFFLGADAAP